MSDLLNQNLNSRQVSEYGQELRSAALTRSAKQRPRLFSPRAGRCCPGGMARWCSHQMILMLVFAVEIPPHSNSRFLPIDSFHKRIS